MHTSDRSIALVDAARLAEVIVDAASFEPAGTGLTVTGFVVDLARVFEDVVCTALTERLQRHGGLAQSQDRWHLDVDRQVSLRPDLFWYAEGPAADRRDRRRGQGGEAGGLPGRRPPPDAGALHRAPAAARPPRLRQGQRGRSVHRVAGAAAGVTARGRRHVGG